MPTARRPASRSRACAWSRARSVRQHRHREARVAAQQHGASHGLRSEPAPHLVERLVEASPRSGSNGSASWTRPSSSRFVDRDADQGQARARSSAWRRRAAPASRPGWSRSAAVARRSVCERVAREKSSNRSRSTTVRPTRRAARIRRVTRSTSADQHRVDLGRRPRPAAQRPLRPDRAPAATCAPAAGRGSRRARAGAAGRPSEQRHQRRLAERGDLADRRDPAVVQLVRRHRADAPQPLDRQRMQERQLPVGRRRPAGRPAWRPRWPPWPGTSSARPRR